MAKLPKSLKLTLHARQRLLERKGDIDLYNTKDLMKSSVKWYGKDDLIEESSLYIHCLYVCRKSKTKFGYMTDGNIEVLYDKSAGDVVTIMEVKDKFKPISQYIKPEYLKQVELKKESKKMKKITTKIGVCPDCERENMELTTTGIHEGLCKRCKTRKINAKNRGKEYIPYKDLSEKERNRIDGMIKGQNNKNKEVEETPVELKAPDPENYYQTKAVQTPVATHPMKVAEESEIKKALDPLSDQFTFIQILREHGCEIPEDNLKSILDVLLSTDKLKNIFTTITDDDNQDAMLNLEQALNVVERKLQHNWEYNGFQEADDIKFKGFLTWRRVLKGAIFFWKKLYQTNTLVEMKKAWDVYTQDPNDKVLLAGDRINTVQKRYQITTESISTIFNTKRSFTRIFFAASKDDAYEKFVKWMGDHQLHENKNKTTIVELSSEGEDGRKEQRA